MDFSVFNLSKDEKTEGFDLDRGKTWIYPANMPPRDYQFNIIKEALFKNTLVCLPTGLGKTFIAAVVMYNFYRWYPNGKIIFMAPTKPLVRQQADACYNIVAIPKNITAELTGSSAQTSRDDLWNEKRVFFITPQILQNDIERIELLGKDIKCLVFDEAHKARGNFAYCEVIKKLSRITRQFRVLALSATPGANPVDVVNVCQNLMIAHLEIRSEECSDVVPYIFKKTVETVVVPLGEKLAEVKREYEQILDKHVRCLIQHKVVYGHCTNLSKGRLFMVLKDFQQKYNVNRVPAYNEIVKTLNICIILYHAYEVLLRHGMRGFLKFFEENGKKPLLLNVYEIGPIINDVTAYMGPAPVLDMLPDGTIPEMPADTKFGHPKYYKLAEILMVHFESRGDETRAIVFCEYQESAREVFAILQKHKPTIRAKTFMGQGAITQKQQMIVLEAFRTGECNVLISTSIGEEGLDVGDVDLVMCFDISNKSSVRMVQRMGRTGRKRDGRVVFLVTDGKERQTLADCLRDKDQAVRAIMSSNDIKRQLCRNNCRMVPDHINPICDKMFITVVKPQAKLKNNNLKNMFSKMEEFVGDNGEMFEFQNKIDLCKKFVQDEDEKDENDINLSNHIERQRFKHSVYGEVESSMDSNILISLLQSAGLKRYNIPLTQSVKALGKTKTNNFKQSDIRTMFMKQGLTQASSDDMDVYVQEGASQLFDLLVLEQLNTALTEYVSSMEVGDMDCKICRNLFPCDIFDRKTDDFEINDWIQPDLSILNDLTVDNLQMFVNNKSSEFVADEIDDFLANMEIPRTQKSPTIGSQRRERKLIPEHVIVHEQVFTSQDLDKELSTQLTPEKKQRAPRFEAPKSAEKLLKPHADDLIGKCRNVLDVVKADFEEVDLDRTITYSPDPEVLESLERGSETTNKRDIRDSEMFGDFFADFISTQNDKKSEKKKVARAISPDLFDSNSNESDEVVVLSDASDTKDNSPVNKNGKRCSVESLQQPAKRRNSCRDIFDRQLLSQKDSSDQLFQSPAKDYFPPISQRKSQDVSPVLKSSQFRRGNEESSSFISPVKGNMSNSDKNKETSWPKHSTGITECFIEQTSVNKDERVSMNKPIADIFVTQRRKPARLTSSNISDVDFANLKNAKSSTPAAEQTKRIKLISSPCSSQSQNKQTAQTSKSSQQPFKPEGIEFNSSKVSQNDNQNRSPPFRLDLPKTHSSKLIQQNNTKPINIRNQNKSICQSSPENRKTKKPDIDISDIFDCEFLLANHATHKEIEKSSEKNKSTVFDYQQPAERKTKKPDLDVSDIFDCEFLLQNHTTGERSTVLNSQQLVGENRLNAKLISKTANTTTSTRRIQESLVKKKVDRLENDNLNSQQQEQKKSVRTELDFGDIFGDDFLTQSPSNGKKNKNLVSRCKSSVARDDGSKKKNEMQLNHQDSPVKKSEAKSKSSVVSSNVEQKQKKSSKKLNLFDRNSKLDSSQDKQKIPRNELQTLKASKQSNPFENSNILDPIKNKRMNSEAELDSSLIPKQSSFSKTYELAKDQQNKSDYGLKPSASSKSKHVLETNNELTLFEENHRKTETLLTTKQALGSSRNTTAAKKSRVLENKYTQHNSPTISGCRKSNKNAVNKSQKSEEKSSSISGKTKLNISDIFSLDFLSPISESENNDNCENHKSNDVTVPDLSPVLSGKNKVNMSDIFDSDFLSQISKKSDNYENRKNGAVTISDSSPVLPGKKRLNLSNIFDSDLLTQVSKSRGDNCENRKSGDVSISDSSPALSGKKKLNTSDIFDFDLTQISKTKSDDCENRTSARASELSPVLSGKKKLNVSDIFDFDSDFLTQISKSKNNVSDNRKNDNASKNNKPWNDCKNRKGANFNTSNLAKSGTPENRNSRSSKKISLSTKKSLAKQSTSRFSKMEDSFNDFVKPPNDEIIILDSDEDEPIVRNKFNGFIDREAELSDDGFLSEDDEDEGGSSQDKFDESFVDDESMRDISTMQAVYLESVKSPVKATKAFAMKQLPDRIEADIFSQAVSDEAESYLNDTFCVSQAVEPTQRDMSELEIAEMLLKERRREKRAARNKPATMARRKRIIRPSDDSD